MRKSLLIFCALAVCAAGTAFGSEIVVLNSESVTFNNVDSVNGLNDPANITLTAPFVGGFLANNVRITGSLTEVLTGTYASEADVAVTAPNGTATLNPTSVTSYTGTVAVGPTNVAIATPFDPAGNVSFQFYESYNDGEGPDQVWDFITMDFQNIGIQNGTYNLGALPNDGSIVSNTGTNVARGLDFYDFSIGEGVPGGSAYLNIQTLDAQTGDTIDTEIGLFDSNGVLVGFDDDGQVSALGGTYSMLSFGAADPFANSDTAAGVDGLTLAAGDYTLVLGGYDTNFEDLTIGVSTIDEVTPGTNAGDYEIRFSYVPEPGTLSLIGVIGLIGLLRRR